MTKIRILPLGVIAATLVLSCLVFATSDTFFKSGFWGEEVGREWGRDQRREWRLERGRESDRGRQVMTFQMFLVDSDGDGKVHVDEIIAAAKAKFSDADTSGEGDITLNEFETVYLALVRDSLVDTFQHIDSDASGQVSKQELSKVLNDFVGEMDRNGDGEVNFKDRLL